MTMCEMLQDVMAYFANVLSSGLERALRFHEDGHASLLVLEGMGINKAQLPRCWPNYWQTVYSRFASGLFHSVIDLHRELRGRFLSTIVAAADHATQSCSDRGATPRRLKLFAFLSHLLAAVSLTSRDEVLGMLSKLNVFIARRAHKIEGSVASSLGENVRPFNSFHGFSIKYTPHVVVNCHRFEMNQPQQ